MGGSRKRPLGNGFAKELCLFEDLFRGLFGFVRRVTVFPQNCPDFESDAGAHTFAQVPVDSHALAHALDELSRDRAKLLVAKDVPRRSRAESRANR